MTCRSLIPALSLLGLSLAACGEDTVGTDTDATDPTTGTPTNATTGETTAGPEATGETESGSTGTSGETTETTETTETDTGLTTDDPTNTLKCDPEECKAGEYCDPEMDICQPGCDEQQDCANPAMCNFETNECEEPCEPGAVEDCYDGPAWTLDVGLCKAGTHVCDDDGFGWSLCEGQVVPGYELCDDGFDNDCDGDIDEANDDDGDGWTQCEGDCCDNMEECTDPLLVNPGAFEVPDNNVDDDCDNVIDNPLGICDVALPSNSSDPLDYAKAMDLCQFTEENPQEQWDLKWGVISAVFTQTDGMDEPDADARSIRDDFGDVIVPQYGSTMSVFSTGHAAAQGQTMPKHEPFQGGEDLPTDANLPADWLDANGGQLPNAPMCPAPQGGSTGNDTIMYKLRLRAPTNANSFKVRMYYFSSEYPEWVCSAFNDFFITLIDSSSPDNPADKNIAIYDDGVDTWPVGVNIMRAAPGLFTQCLNGVVGCNNGATPGVYNGCTGTDELAGTGFDVENPPMQHLLDMGYCGTNNLAGGGTSWLEMHGNVVPGEVFELRFAMWDTGDGYYDSLILLDHFEWSVEASEPGVIVPE